MRHTAIHPARRMKGGANFFAFLVGMAVTFAITMILVSAMSDDKPQEHVVYMQPQLNSGQVSPTYRNHVVKSQLANVMALLAPVKMQIATYYQMSGEFPRNGRDIDLAMFDLNEHELIQSATITTQGALKVGLSNAFGQTKKMVMQPKASKNGAFIKWNCLTNVDKQHLGPSATSFCNYSNML